MRCGINRLTLTFASTSEMNATWEFPAEFIDDDYKVSPTLRGVNDNTAPGSIAANATPTIRQIIAPSYGSKTTTNCMISCSRIEDGTLFASGDLLYVGATAGGKMAGLNGVKKRRLEGPRVHPT